MASEASPEFSPAAHRTRARMRRRLLRDPVTVAAGAVVLLVVLAVFAGGEIAPRLVGHGPNDLFPYAVDEEPGGDHARPAARADGDDVRRLLADPGPSGALPVPEPPASVDRAARPRRPSARRRPAARGPVCVVGPGRPARRSRHLVGRRRRSGRTTARTGRRSATRSSGRRRDGVARARRIRAAAPDRPATRDAGGLAAADGGRPARRRRLAGRDLDAPARDLGRPAVAARQPVERRPTERILQPASPGRGGAVRQLSGRAAPGVQRRRGVDAAPDPPVDLVRAALRRPLHADVPGHAARHAGRALHPDRARQGRRPDRRRPAARVPERDPAHPDDARHGRRHRARRRHLRRVYRLPGLGQISLVALRGNLGFDRPFLVGTALVVGLAVLALSFLVDLLHVVVDPRISAPRQGARTFARTL